MPAASRSISLWPFRKRIDPSLPVYFPREEPKFKINTRSIFKKIRYGVFSLGMYIIMYQIFMSFVFDPLLDWSDEEWEKMSEKEKQAMEKEVQDDDEPIAFFAWPFSTYQEESPPYKGSDPEWKEFVAINSDKKRQKEIKNKFAGEVQQRLLKHPTVQKMMGKEKPKISRAWLDIMYPPKPPPVQYVSGLIIDEDGIFWGYRQMDELSLNYLKHITYPKAVAAATWAFYSTVIPEGFYRLFSSEKQNDSVESSWQGSILTRGKDENRHIPQTGPPLFTPPKQQQNGQNGPRSPHELGPNQPFKLDAQGRIVPVDGTMTGVVGAAILNAWSKHRKPVEPTVNRGSIRLDGMVEFKGKGGLLTVMAAGWYDPKLKKFTSIKVVTKSFVPYNQRPMGGP